MKSPLFPHLTHYNIIFLCNEKENRKEAAVLFFITDQAVLVVYGFVAVGGACELSACGIRSFKLGESSEGQASFRRRFLGILELDMELISVFGHGEVLGGKVSGSFLCLGGYSFDPDITDRNIVKLGSDGNIEGLICIFGYRDVIHCPIRISVIVPDLDIIQRYGLVFCLLSVEGIRDS